MRHVVVFLLLALVPFIVNAQDTSSNQAPFGLSWGMSTAQVKAIGVELTDVSGVDWGKSFSAKKLPKILSDAQYVYLSFGYNDKLWRIGVISRSFDNDPAGGSVLVRYNELNGILVEKYGKGKSVQYLPKHGRQEHFTMYVKGGDAHWFTTFETPQMMVELGVGADDYSTTFWRLIFEDKALADEFKKAKKADERGTL